MSTLAPTVASAAAGAPAPGDLPKPVPVVAPPAAGAPPAIVDDRPVVDPAAPKPADAPDLARARTLADTARKAQRAADERMAAAQRLEATWSTDWKALALSDPDAFAKKIGLDNFEAYLSHYATRVRGQAPPQETADDKIARIERERETERTQQSEQALARVKHELGQVVAKAIGGVEDYDLVNTLGRQPEIARAVFDYTLKYPDLTEDQGSAAVHYFARQLEAKLEAEHFGSLTKSAKFGKRFAAREGAPPANAAAGDGQKGLNNTIVREESAAPVDYDAIKDDGERWKAILRDREKLTKK